MSWKNQTQSITPHQRYQLEVIFLYLLGFTLLFPYYFLIERLQLDTHVWQWVFFVPWNIFYIAYSLGRRNKIPGIERVNPYKRHIGYWVMLGIALLAIHLEPTHLNDLYTFDLSFFIFTMFLADSYWDFRTMKRR